MVCFDAWSPIAWQELLKEDVDLICNPANYCGLDGLELCQRSAAEYHTPVILSNRTGKDWSTGTDVRFVGHSAIINDKGRVIKTFAEEEGASYYEFEI